ncbi:MAG: cobalamin biosynthesis protein CobW [Oligoflexia bacterium]|nr:cobalamin biosynthesis protein CobW [Oligoflexia bacterium]
MESIIVIVGFLGAGKTTLLKKLVKDSLAVKKNPFVILNDYQNANMDAQHFLDTLEGDHVKAMSGSCICCSGVTELRSLVNTIPERENAITLVEANGTTDSASLMGFLGVGLKERFSPPVQVSVVDVKHWQKRGIHNELESNQIQVSSLIILNHLESVDSERIDFVMNEIRKLNPYAIIKKWNEVEVEELQTLIPSTNKAQKMDHAKAHWSSCSVDLPDPISSKKMKYVLENLPESILRVKGCTRLDEDEHYSFIEMVPSGDVFVKPYHGDLITGPKLLVIGPGSDPELLENLLK